MANSLTVQLVKIVDLDDQGREIGEPHFGVVASDAYERDFDWGHASFAELLKAIDAAGGTLCLLNGFDGADAELVGTRNYLGPLSEGQDDAEDG